MAAGETKIAAARDESPPPHWRAAAAGMAALLLGIGLSRFGFTPLIPALIEAGWFGAGAATALGSTNLAGYLLGAAASRYLAEHAAPATLIRGAMIVGVVSFVACAAPLGFAWYFAWRLISGIIGGILMVLAPTTILPTIPAAWRARAAGLIFTGVGTGIALSGTLIPWLVRFGLPTTWLVLAGAAAALTAFAWPEWRRAMRPLPHASATPLKKHAALSPALLLFGIAYAFIGIGFVPHTVFWTDFIARGLGRGLGVGGFYWMLLGLGAMSGPLATGLLAERIGFGAAYAWCLVAMTICVGLPLMATGPIALAISSLGIGVVALGTVSLASGRIGELAAPENQRQVWGWITIAYAVVYAGGGYAFSFVFARTGSYDAIFATGAAATLLATVFAFLSARPATSA